MRMTKESYRKQYNEIRKEFMQAHGIKASETAPRLTKKLVDKMTTQEVKEIANVFKTRDAHRMTYKEQDMSERVSKSMEAFEGKLLKIVNRQRADLHEELVEQEATESGIPVNLTRAQMQGERSSDFGPLKLKPSKTAEKLRENIMQLIGKAEDPAGDKKLKESLIKAVVRSSIPGDDAVDIAGKINSMTAKEVAKLFYQEEFFNFDYIYSLQDAVEKSMLKARKLRQILGLKEDEKVKVSDATKKKFEEYIKGMDINKTIKRYGSF